MNVTSVVLVGVGGQGILLASEIVARAALEAGFDVKTNEVHGMAQRGGSVIAQVRFGREVASPLIPHRTAVVLGALEQVESLRYVDYLAPDGLAVVSRQRIVPVTVSSGAATYPDITPELLRQYFPNLIDLDAVGIAQELASMKVSNTVILGAMSTRLSAIPQTAWDAAIAQSVKPGFVEINREAFQRGRAEAMN
ncbi:MAG: indolepyruvate oxidoreductase subunit beta [Thermoguttaceae bacterium]